MYEAYEGLGSSLHPETQRRIREVFGGQTCSVCGAAAARLSGGRFFCVGHFQVTRRNPRPPRVYHCRLAVKA
jgi:hypothetical protein